MDGPADDEQRSALLCLNSVLQMSERIVTPPAQYVVSVSALLSRVPPQSAMQEGDGPFESWMCISAAAELVGMTITADEMLQRLYTEVRVHPDKKVARIGKALIWARRGRIARTFGELDRASACYHESLRLSYKWRSDSWYQSLLGLSVLAGMRGNFPELEGRCTAIVQHRGSPSIYLVACHQMLSTLYRKRGAYVEAMLHCWHAFDLIPPGDARRSELVVALSSIALTAGDRTAARRGFLQVLDASPPLRIHVAAVEGLSNVEFQSILEATGRPRSVDGAVGVLQQCKTLLEQSLPPHERVSLLISASRLARVIGENSDAAEFLKEAESLSKLHDLFELQLEMEIEHDERSSAPSSSSSERTFAEKPAKRHAALNRLVELQSL